MKEGYARNAKNDFGNKASTTSTAKIAKEKQEILVLPT